MAKRGERDDWRTRGDFPDSGDSYVDGYKQNDNYYPKRDGDYYRRDDYNDRRYDARYDRRSSYDAGEYVQHPKQGKRGMKKSKQRPNSSNTNRRNEDGNISDTSTHSEPPLNKKKSQQENKPFSNNSKEERTKDDKDTSQIRIKANDSQSANTVNENPISSTNTATKNNPTNTNTTSGSTAAVNTNTTSGSTVTTNTTSGSTTTTKTNTSGNTAASKGTTVPVKYPKNGSISQNPPVQTKNNPSLPAASLKNKTITTQSPASSNTSQSTTTGNNANVQVETSKNLPKKDAPVQIKDLSLTSNPISPKTTPPAGPIQNPSANNQSNPQSKAEKVLNTQDETLRTSPKREELQPSVSIPDIPPKIPDHPPPPAVPANPNPAKISTDIKSDKQSNLAAGDSTNPQSPKNESNPPNPPFQIDNPPLSSPTTPIEDNTVQSSVGKDNSGEVFNDVEIQQISPNKGELNPVKPSAPVQDTFPAPPNPDPTTGNNIKTGQLNKTDKSQINEHTPDNPELNTQEDPNSTFPNNISSKATNSQQTFSLHNITFESLSLTSPIITTGGASQTLPDNPFTNTQGEGGVHPKTNPFSMPVKNIQPQTQLDSLPKDPCLPSNTSQPGNSIAVKDTTEADRNQNSINTRPSNQFIPPKQSGISQSSTISDSFSQDLFPDSMSNEDPSQLIEKVKSLTDELEATKNKANEAEKREKSSLTDLQRVTEDNARITKELEQKKKDFVTKDQDIQKVSDELQKEKQQVVKLTGEKKKTADELNASKKECENLKTQVKESSIDQATIKDDLQKVTKEKQHQFGRLTDFESKSKKFTKDLTEKQKEITDLKAFHTAEIKELKKTMDSNVGDSEALSGMKKNIEEKDAKLKQIEKELQTARKDKTRLETENMDNIQEINQLTQQLGLLEKEQANLKENISQLEREIEQNAALMKSYVDIELLTKIEEAFIGLSNQVPPSEYAPGSPDCVEWLVASLTSWNADLMGKISTNESLLFEKQTEIDMNRGELQAIQNYLQEQMPTNKSITNFTDKPLNLVQIIIAEKMEQLSKANESIKKIESDKQTMEIQIQDIRQHYNNEDSKNDQLMKDNAALERQIQTLISEKEELEVKNVELINELCELRDGSGNFNNPTLHAINTLPSHLQESFNSRPSPLYLESTSPFPFDSPASPPPTALSSLTQGNRSTLQKAADELSRLKVKVWESEAENSKLREQLAVRNRDPTFPATISPDAESAFHAVFEANQSNLLKLSESLREKDMMFKDVEFLRQRIEDLEKNIERHKVSIEVKEVAYKELYTECRDWERKYKKCGQVHHEMERVKRQLMRKEAETQECATLRAERLNRQTTLDNLLAELQERKKIEQNLKRENHKLHAKLDDCLKHISNMQTHIQDQITIDHHKNSQPEEPHYTPPPQTQQEPRPASPTILKPPSMSSIPLSPPTRQPATKRHPPILYPPTS